MKIKKHLVWLCIIATLAIVVFVWLSNGSGFGKLSEVLPGTYRRELQRVSSPDHRSVAVFWSKEKHGIALPPEPAKTLERWARLEITRNGVSIYDSSYENLNNYQRSFGLDAMWSPDSMHLAYRHINSLRTIDSTGKALKHEIQPETSVISSFRWMDKENLLIVSKKLETPLSDYGTPYPCYPSYIEKAEEIRITRLNLTGGNTLLHHQPLKSTTFLFHALDFSLDEISPGANRVAFGDGIHLSIYDVTVGKIIVQIVIPQKPPVVPVKPEEVSAEMLESIKEIAEQRQELEGLWWRSNDELVVGVGLMGSYSKSFYTYEIPSNRLTDVTNILLPIWEGSDNAKNYQDPEWFQTAFKP